MNQKLHELAALRPNPSLFSATLTSNLPVKQLVSIVFRRRRTIANFFLLITSIAIAFVMFLPARYKSTLKILVKNERADNVLSSEETTHGDRQSVREETINSEIELLRSADLIRQLVVKLRLHEVEQSDQAKGDISQTQTDIAIERAATELSRNLEVAPIKKADVIEVTYTSKDAAQPAMILDLLRCLESTT